MAVTISASRAASFCTNQECLGGLRTNVLCAKAGDHSATTATPTITKAAGISAITTRQVKNRANAGGSIHCV